MAPPSSWTGVTIHIYLYYVLATSYWPHTCSQGHIPPGTLIGASTSSTDVDPYQISWTYTGPNQTSPTDIGIGKNISNGRWFRVNCFFLPPHIPFWRRDRSQLIQSLTKYPQQTLGLQRSSAGCEHLSLQTPRLCPTLLNRLRGHMNCLQPPPRLDELLSTNSRAFEPGAVTPPKMSEIFTVGGPPTRSSEAFLTIMIDWLVLVF